MKFQAVMLLLFLGVAATVSAMPYVAGPYTVDVDIRNRTMAPILHGDVYCQWLGERILVMAKAPGYETSEQFITPDPGQTLYRLNIVMNESEYSFRVIDDHGVPIESAYFDVSQSGFASNEIGVKLFIPKVIWPQPDPVLIEVMEKFWWLKMKKTIKIDSTEEFHRLTIAMERRKEFPAGDVFTVVVGIPHHPDVNRLLIDLSHLANMENNPQQYPAETIDRLARYMIDTYSAEELKAAMKTSGIRSKTLEKLLGVRAAFLRAHGEDGTPMPQGLSRAE